MKGVLLFILLLSSVFSFSQSFGFEWAIQFGDGAYVYGIDVETDNSGNSIVVGTFFGSVDFDNGIGNTTLTSAGDRDVFVLKFDPQGILLWAISRGGVNIDIISSVSIDVNDNIIITGGFESAPTFGLRDIYIEKLDSYGNNIWTKIIGGSGIDHGSRVITQNDGTILVSGFFSSTVDFDLGPGSSIVTANGTNDLFILKLDSLGDFIWASSIGGESYIGSSSIVHSDSGNIYICGSFYGTVDFDPGIGVLNLTANGGTDGFVSKLDSIGQLIWVKTFGGSNDDNCGELILDSNDNIYITGSFSNSVDFNSTGIPEISTSNGGKDIFLLKLNSNSNFNWVRSIGGSWNDMGVSLSLNSYNDIFLTGIFVGNIDANPGLDSFTLYNNGGEDFLIEKLDSSGNFIWARGFGGVDLDRCYAIKSDKFGYIYATGLFRDVVNFDPDAGGFTLSSSLTNTGFLLKLGETVAINENVSTNNLIQVFPNPAQSQIKIKIPFPNQKYRVILFSSAGQEIISYSLKGEMSEIVIDNLNRGIYFLKVIFTDMVFTKKVIIN